MYLTVDGIGLASLRASLLFRFLMPLVFHVTSVWSSETAAGVAEYLG